MYVYIKDLVTFIQHLSYKKVGFIKSNIKEFLVCKSIYSFYVTKLSPLIIIFRNKILNVRSNFKVTDWLQETFFSLFKKQVLVSVLLYNVNQP